MRRVGGYAVIEDANGRREADTFTCCHCSTVVFVGPKSDPGGFCRLCMKAICPQCAGNGSCVPFERKLEAAERSNRLMRAARGEK